MSLEVLGGRSGKEQLWTQLFNFEYLFQDFSWYVGSSKALEDKEMSSSPEDFIFEIKLFYTNAACCFFFSSKMLTGCTNCGGAGIILTRCGRKCRNFTLVEDCLEELTVGKF